MGAVVKADRLDDQALPIGICTGKALFHNRCDAQQMANRMTRSKGVGIVAFRCDHCRGWHVGRNLRR